MNVGSEVQHNGQPALVVRKVHSQSLFEDAAGNIYTLDEDYYELQAADGALVFITTECIQSPATKQGNIRGLDPQIWRPRNATQV